MFDFKAVANTLNDIKNYLEAQKKQRETEVLIQTAAIIYCKDGTTNMDDSIASAIKLISKVKAKQ